MMQLKLKVLVSSLILLQCFSGTNFTNFNNTPYCQNGLVNRAGKMYGILVGVDWPGPHYKHKLHGPYKEVQELVQFLDNDKQQYGIITLVNEHASKEAILNSLRQIIANAKSEDRVLFYFTGHAAPLSSIRDSITIKLYQDLHDKRGDEYFLIPYQDSTEIYKDSLHALLSLEEIANILNGRDKTSDQQRLPIRQRILIIDACYGGYFVNVSPLTTNMFDNELPPDGFYALTSLKAVLYDGLYGPIILCGLKGKADQLKNGGNQNGKVSFWELTNYIDYEVREKFGTPQGEKFSSRYIFIGSGEVNLSITE